MIVKKKEFDFNRLDSSFFKIIFVFKELSKFLFQIVILMEE